MKPLSGCALLLLGARAAFAINFVPTQETQMIDTYPIHYYSFEDEGRRVAYGPPNGWKCTGTGSKLLLEDPKTRQATVEFTALPIPSPGPFNAGSLKNFQTFARSLAPADSQVLAFTETSGQHIIGGRESYTANLSYAFYGVNQTVRVTYVNLDKYCLQIVTSAPAPLFDAFSDTLETSLCSWHWMTAK